MNSQLILIVDDEIPNLVSLSALLEEEYEVLMATNGVEALALAESRRPDLIILDINMPDMDGFEACKRLKENPATAETPVLFLSGLGDRINEEKGLRLGAVDYITKPIVPAIVQVRVQIHLNNLNNIRFLRTLLKEKSEFLAESQKEAAGLLKKMEKRRWFS